MVWVAPCHEGAIRYYKEAGLWTPEAQKNNEAMLARQAFLQKAWQEHLAAEVPGDRFEQAWMKLRAEKLHEDGMMADRKSVVVGKSVSVREDPGGSRLLKSTTHRTRDAQ